MQNVFNRIIKISIYLLVFLVPLFFLSFSFEAFEFNKQYLLFFLVSLGLFTWLAKMVLIDKEIRFKRTPLDIPVLAFLFIAILSAVFSVDKVSSLLGFYGRFSDGLIGLISLVMMYFLITNNVGVQEEKITDYPEGKSKISSEAGKLQITSLLKVFLWSVFFVISMTYFSIFGIWAKIQSLTGLNLPQVLMQRTFNPVSGSMEGLAIFLSIIVILLVGLILFRIKNYELIIKNIFSYFLLIASLFLLIVIDFTVAWFLLLITLILFVGFTLWKRIFRQDVNKLLLPIFLIIIALLFIVLNPLKNTQIGPLQFSLSQERILNQGSSWQIGFRAATDDIKSGFLGSGIGTFQYDFSKFKSAELNQTPFWQIRFDRAGNYIAEILGTIGFLGIFSYLILIGLFLIISWFFVTEIAKEAKKLGTGALQSMLLLTFFALFIGQFLYYQNTTLAFMFWLFLGLSVVSWQRPIKEKVISFKNFPELSLIFSMVVIILALAILLMYFFTGKFYLADINYKNGQRTANIQNLEKAVNLNPWRINYRLSEARAYLGEALNETQKPAVEQDSIKIQNRVSKAIDEVKIATSISPNRVGVWEVLGVIYRDIRGLAAGATEWGIKSFEKAIALEPTNPALYTELGKLLVSETPERAKAEFEKAIELKPDYLDAQIQIALLLEQENNLTGAIRKLEGLANLYPFDINTLFQLGRLYYNNNQIDGAILKFQQVVLLFPNHSNAHYSLGVAYSAKGEKERAIAEFERVLELNPENEDIRAKLKELRK